ncbi:protein chibby homolog 2 [Tiliqua scincoides]|uniref:protein chibby homolog 2 n=1 Tax=Tiliqua scincoides TaxID=71010 RepID=UPI00346214D2
MDYIPPRVKLSDDTFVFIDGKWVNETYIQSALSEAHQKHSMKKTHNEWSLWEENKALWEENKALRLENRVLREENKALQCLRMENKGIQVIYDEHLQQVLQQDKKPLGSLPALGGLQDGMEKKSLPFLREENKALQIFREQNMTLKAFTEETPSTVLQMEKQSAQLLGKEGAPVQESSKTVVPETSKNVLTQVMKTPQEIQEESRSLPVQVRNKSSLSPLDESEAFEAVRRLNQTMLFLLRENHGLAEEKQILQTVQGGNRILWEENNKLKLQQNSIKEAINKIMAQLAALQEELNSFTSTQELPETGMKKPESY